MSTHRLLTVPSHQTGPTGIELVYLTDDLFLIMGDIPALLLSLNHELSPHQSLLWGTCSFGIDTRQYQVILSDKPLERPLLSMFPIKPIGVTKFVVYPVFSRIMIQQEIQQRIDQFKIPHIYSPFLEPFDTSSLSDHVAFIRGTSDDWFTPRCTTISYHILSRATSPYRETDARSSRLYLCCNPLPKCSVTQLNNVSGLFPPTNGGNNVSGLFPPTNGGNNVSEHQIDQFDEDDEDDIDEYLLSLDYEQSNQQDEASDDTDLVPSFGQLSFPRPALNYDYEIDEPISSLPLWLSGNIE